MNSSLRVLANFIDLINLHLQMTVGAHIVRPKSNGMQMVYTGVR